MSKNDEDAALIGRSVLFNVNAPACAVLARLPFGDGFDRSSQVQSHQTSGGPRRHTIDAGIG
jgi:hypothetical protein